MQQQRSGNRLWQQIGWLILMWVSSVAVLWVVATLLRFLMRVVGMTT